jgi:hypothetical protein
LADTTRNTRAFYNPNPIFVTVKCHSQLHRFSPPAFNL